MLQIKNSNFKRVGALVVLGLTTSLALGLLHSSPSHALTCDENSMVSCIDITFGKIVGSTDLKAPSTSSTSQGIDKAYFYLPVSLTIAHSNDFSINVYSQNNGQLKNTTGDSIPTLSGEAAKGTSLQDLGRDGSVWGYRFNLGDTADDPAKNYLKVPSKNDPEASIVSRTPIADQSGTISKILTLGFATAVDANLPAGSYSDNIVVAVTATPKQTTAFGLISTMQEMTPEICASATTPRADAQLPDATGIHHGDDRYVPEATLIDTRDNKPYLIRKLADGDCWMSQNLELDILASDGQYYTGTTFDGTNYTGATVSANEMYTKTLDGSLIKLSLDASNTDLNSTTGALNTPAKIFTTISATRLTDDGNYAWQINGDDGMRSYSYNASDPGWNYSVVNQLGTSTTASTFKNSSTGRPYERRGNAYNWTAATLGSSLTFPAGTQQAEDSLCPRGWRLPLNGQESDIDPSTVLDNITNKSFAKLLRTYGVDELQGSSIPNFNRINAWPLQFPRTGYYNSTQGYLRNITKSGLWWSNAMSGPIKAIALDSYANGIHAQRDFDRGNGLSIRCVAR